MIRDNREFIDVLKKHKELVEINEQVTWDMEMGAIVRRASEHGAPAPLFLNIKDYPGSKVLGGPVANFKRIALAMGMDPDTHPREIIREFTKRSNNPIKPVLIKDAPCQENVIEGDDVDLSMFPTPMVHGGDGGRYIGTWHFVLADDPDEGWSNWGMYRLMLHNERHMGGLILPASDMGKIKAKYEAKGQTLPFAAVIAPDPLSAIASTVSPPPGISESDLAGGLMGQPIELVQCKTVDLRVPATAEIILEGEILKDVFVDEGPFGEYTGYRSSPRMPRAVYKVNCVTFRNDPIFAMTNMGIPIDEGQITYATLGLGSEMEKLLKKNGVPITDVYVPPEGVGHLVIVGTKTPYSNIAQIIANLIYGSPVGKWSHQIIVVSEDVDVFNIGEVIHAFATKCHPLNGITTYPSFGHPLAPYLSFHERTWGKGGRVVIDCTWPLDWDEEIETPVKSSFKTIYPQEIQDLVESKWEKYGY